MIIDLSAASDGGLALILKRMPVKELLLTCTQVSPQWNRILSESYFWRDKMDYDGYHLDWPKLTGINTKSFQMMALKHCFGRNFIKDSWDSELRNEHSLKLDPRWNADDIIWKEEDIPDPLEKIGHARIEIPPVFIDGQPEIPPEFVEQIPACLAVGYDHFVKVILIKLADEGLTDDIMDNFRPTIVVSEMVANRRDCGSRYQMVCSLVSEEAVDQIDPNYYYFCQPNVGDFHEVNNGNTISVMITLPFEKGRAEGWNHVEHKFKDYPVGMRYLRLRCLGRDRRLRFGHYGVKMANCSVKALFEKNAE